MRRVRQAASQGQGAAGVLLLAVGAGLRFDVGVALMVAGAFLVIAALAASLGGAS